MIRINVFQTAPRSYWTVELVPENGKRVTLAKDAGGYEAEDHVRHWSNKFDSSGEEYAVFRTECIGGS